jgi:hypothetical protein
MKSLATKTKSSTSGTKKTGTQRTSSVRPMNAATRAQVRDILRPHGLQPKLTIGRQGDRYEQEADTVADRVVAGLPVPEIPPLSPGSLQTQPIEEEEEFLQPYFQRQPLEEEEEIQARSLSDQITPLVQRQVEPEEEEELIQAKTAGDVTPEVTPAITSGIQSLQNGGQPLSKRERSFFEPRFGVDFSNVRVHDDTRAASVTRSVNARAFTFGRNIVFGAGEYSPDISSGKKLLAHELTHVMQQNGAPTLFSPGKNSENTIPNSPELPRIPPEFHRSINCTDGENTKEEDSPVLKEINRGCEARNTESSSIRGPLIFGKIQTSQSLMKQTAPKERKLKKLVPLKISVPEGLPKNLQVCVPVAQRFLDQVKNDYRRWYYGVRNQTKTDYLRRSAAFWKKPENIQFDPRRHKGCKLVIQKLLPKKFSHKFIEELRDVYSDHVIREKTKSLWIISDVLGVKNLKVGFHPYEIKVFSEGGIGFPPFSQQEAHVGIRKWSKDKNSIIWQDDFWFHVSTVSLGGSFKFSPPIGGKQGAEIMEPVCFDMNESNISYSGDSDWEPFESRLGWSPDDFKNATISVVSGPSAEALFIEGKLDTRVDICHSRKGCIKLPTDKISIKLTGVGAKVVELGKGKVTGGFFPPEFCNPNQIISEEDIEILKWMASEEHALLYRAGKWELTESQRTQLKDWLLSDPINGLLRAPDSELKTIGYASPFWATAKTYEEMMLKNKHLSFMRAIAVSNFVDDTLKDALAADVYMSHVGCEEYIEKFGKPRNFRIYRREYGMFQRVDLILNDNLIFTVEF